MLDVLYGLAARYSPAELQLYLLDFKEGVSFTEFVPTGRDPSWLPHARAVGIESDREYGLAVLRELRREAQRRATALKRHGVTKLADLPLTIRCRASWRSSTSSTCCWPATTRWPAKPWTCWRSWPARAARTASTWCSPARA
ncbi:FtsK/SpoIIIE domain-containing protein [Micromonospora sp. M12]